MSKGTSALNSPKVLRRVNMRILYQTFGRRRKDGVKEFERRHCFVDAPSWRVLSCPQPWMTAESGWKPLLRKGRKNGLRIPLPFAQNVAHRSATMNLSRRDFLARAVQAAGAAALGGCATARPAKAAATA